MLVSNFQHCWMLHFAPFCTCCCALLGVVAQSLKPVKRFATCKRTQQLPSSLLGISVALGRSLTCIALCNWTQHCWPTISQHCWMLHVASVCTSYCMLFSFLRVVAQCLIPVKRLATGQQCWELLRPFARTLCVTFISHSWLSVSRLDTTNILPVWLMR